MFIYVDQVGDWSPKTQLQGDKLKYSFIYLHSFFSLKLQYMNTGCLTQIWYHKTVTFKLQ